MHQHSEPESGFFAIKISEAFEFRPDWYRKGPVAERVLEYYWLLRSVLRERPEARRCLCRCRHCRIFFIADPRNAGRQDLGCPFGCQEAHRKGESTRRSVAYYQEAEGKIKKRLLNGKRSIQLSGVGLAVAGANGTEPCGAKQEPEPEPEPEASAEQIVASEAPLEHCQRCRWSEALLEHVRVVCVLIDVSRFVMDGNVVDRNSEKVMLKIPVQRDDCCHHAGSLDFGPGGNLFISTGDNTHPAGDSGGYGPIDEREGKHAYDAQDTAGNTNDLRGKILRIHPMLDGSYTIPDDNLFVKGGEIAGLPEIYVMGCRNPWRMNVDQKTGYVYWGEVGPDAGGDGPRGPRGYDELNQARAAGNFGWPFFIANNRPYADHDYVTGKTGALYDVEKPMNISPSNTGSKLLPKPQPAWIYYPYAASEEFPMVGSGGRTACAGPVYHFDPNLDSPTKLPEALDNSLIMFDWQRTFIKRVKLDADSNIVSIDPFLTNIPIKRPVDMRIGPEGALYVLDYGETWGVNEDARLLQINYFKGNRPPVAAISASPGLVGKHPFDARFSGAESSDPDDGDALTYTWSVSPGAFEMQTAEQATFVFNEPGIFDVTLLVNDAAGLEDKASVQLAIGNAPPAIQFIEPLDGGFFEWGDEVAYRIVAQDAEDGSSEDAPDFMKMRLLLNHFVNATAPGTAEAAYLSGIGKNSAGLSLIQQSDCLNCHAVDRKIIGPSFKEIALRYAKAEKRRDAVNASADRIIKGSSKVWGEVPMLLHAQFSQEQARTIVRWVYSLADESNDSAVRQEFAGKTKLDRPDWMKDGLNPGFATLKQGSARA